MKRKSHLERIRAALFLAIKRTTANLDTCVKVPGKDFSRTRKLPLQAMLLMLIGMGSGSLSKELYDWFGYTSSTATASAFVQQRNKIRPEAVKMIFNEFVSSTTPNFISPASRPLGTTMTVPHAVFPRRFPMRLSIRKPENAFGSFAAFRRRRPAC